MRISDWSSDVCSSDLRECIRGKQAGKLQCCLQSRLLVEAPEPEFLREPLPTLDDFEVVLRPQYSDRVPGIGISAATQPNASDEYLRWLAVRRSLHRTRSEEHTSELQSLMRISYAVFCLKKNTKTNKETHK